MSRLVMLPNARCVPEFPPVSPCGKLGLCPGAYREFERRARLRSKSPEADYLEHYGGLLRERGWLYRNHTLATDPATDRAGGPGGTRRRGFALCRREGGIRRECGLWSHGPVARRMPRAGPSWRRAAR